MQSFSCKDHVCVLQLQYSCIVMSKHSKYVINIIINLIAFFDGKWINTINKKNNNTDEERKREETEERNTTTANSLTVIFSQFAVCILHSNMEIPFKRKKRQMEWEKKLFVTPVNHYDCKIKNCRLKVLTVKCNYLSSDCDIHHNTNHPKYHTL